MILRTSPRLSPLFSCLVHLNYARSAVGYTYNVPFNSSYNPVSRQGSAGQTSDSEVNSK